VASSFHHFSGNSYLSRAEFPQAIFDEALEFKVIASKPKVVAITTKEFPTLAKRLARSQLTSNKLRRNFGIDVSGCMLGIRSSFIAIKNESH
jgi:dTDP-4-dehydrorhamnose reductase